MGRLNSKKIPKTGGANAEKIRGWGGKRCAVFEQKQAGHLQKLEDDEKVIRGKKKKGKISRRLLDIEKRKVGQVDYWRERSIFISPKGEKGISEGEREKKRRKCIQQKVGKFEKGGGGSLERASV